MWFCLGVQFLDSLKKVTEGDFFYLPIVGFVITNSTEAILEEEGDF